jgi:thiol:disulfide interchange protein DsbA
MKISASALLLAALLCNQIACSKPAAAENPSSWTEGRDYSLIIPAQPTSVPPGKVAVTEVFSYGCPVCNRFLPVMHKLKSSLPANVVIDYLPASFNPGEDWPMFQRAYLTAQMLGIADKAHDAMFDAVWKTGELGIFDSAGNLKAPMPTIQDAARFYNRVTGTPIADFVATAQSMGVDTRVGQADNLLIRYRVSSTPILLVNGKYRIDSPAGRNPEAVIALVKWLAAKESH